MNEPFLKKYKPIRLNSFSLDKNFLDIINALISINSINLLLIGNSGSGKTSLLHAIIREYYNIDILPKNNILYINTLHEQGISYYRNEVKTFCQTPTNLFNKKKIIIIDDIDTMNEQSQQVFRNCIDKYSHLVNFIATSNNSQKVVESLQSRLTFIKIKPLHDTVFKNVLNKIKDNEKIVITPTAERFILKISNNSIRELINYMEKFKLYGGNIDINIAKKICTNISYSDFEKYTKSCLKHNIKCAFNTLDNIYKKGYSVIDILDSYYNFVKYTDLFDEKTKYQLIKLISEYITIFYNIHEQEIELLFLTTDICKLL